MILEKSASKAGVLHYAVFVNLRKSPEIMTDKAKAASYRRSASKAT